MKHEKCQNLMCRRGVICAGPLTWKCVTCRQLYITDSRQARRRRVRAFRAYLRTTGSM